MANNINGCRGNNSGRHNKIAMQVMLLNNWNWNGQCRKSERWTMRKSNFIYWISFVLSHRVKASVQPKPLGSFFFFSHLSDARSQFLFDFATPFYFLDDNSNNRFVIVLFCLSHALSLTWTIRICVGFVCSFWLFLLLSVSVCRLQRGWKEILQRLPQ